VFIPFSFRGIGATEAVAAIAKCSMTMVAGWVPLGGASGGQALAA
jgi:hypothetical protein